MEVWKDVAGFEQAYQVSNLGRVKSKIRKGVIKERFLKPFLNNQGYELVDLWDNTHKKKLVHRLVAEVFILGKRFKAGGLRWSYDFGGEE